MNGKFLRLRLFRAHQAGTATPFRIIEVSMWIKVIAQRETVRMLLSVMAAGVLTGCGSDDAPPGPPLERVSAWHQSPEYHVGDSTTLLEWLNAEAPERTVYNPEYRWPNGLAASMTPFLVDWDHSVWHADNETEISNRYLQVNNVYVGGNPVLGQTRLATVRIPAGGVQAVEFVVVRYHLKGMAKTSGHVQLRFVFDADRRPRLLNRDGSVNADQPYLDDLILSWEAWRPTMQAWGFKTGLDPQNYMLTPRMYAGSQRFLQDSLRGAVWDCYPLDLSVHDAMGDAVLLSGLLLGDGVGRELIWSMLEDGLINDPTEEVKNTWKDEDQVRARSKFAWEGMAEHPIKPHLKGVDTGYHALQRSCINATLKQIDVAMQWLYETHDLGRWNGIDVAPAKIPRWFDDVVEGNRWGKIYRAPYALIWLMGHKEVLPYQSHRVLRKAGLLQVDDKGGAVFYRYGPKESSPYGPLNKRIM